ncbi:PPi-type phosphoenolpyruvate carboxykinase 2 [Entamoeba marina]
MFNQDQGTSYPILSVDNLKSLANLKLAMTGHQHPVDGATEEGLKLAGPLLEEVQESSLSSSSTAPIDQRLQTFLNTYFADCKEEIPQIPNETFVLDREGLARVLTLPPEKDEFFSETMSSYRHEHGILNNPAKDKRTTVGVFHITEGSIPVPADKIQCPKIAFLRMLKAAFYDAPKEHLVLPYTADCKEPTHTWVSLYMRPTVIPAVEGVKGFNHEKRYENHFFVPGNMIACLDFVESVFGNAGNPTLCKNDAALDPLGWTGTSGMVVLAPHLTKMTKKQVGLPHISEATQRQKDERMCWEKEDELYNDGRTFKMTVRDASGVVCTIVADNYFGYCKKEIKTQISFSANLYGLAEEEHAGGAIARPSYDLGESCKAERYADGYKFEEMIEKNKNTIIVKDEGYAVDKKYPEGIIYVPESSIFSIEDASIKFTHNGVEQTILLIPKINYVLPNGYTVILHDTMTSRRWTLRGILPKYTFCHKPSTVSGGGKSEISKSIKDAVIEGGVFVNNKEEDFKKCDEILNHDFSKRFKNEQRSKSLDAPLDAKILDPNFSLGSVVELLTPSKHFTDEHNEYVKSLPPMIIELVMTIKSLYREEWQGDWKSHVSVNLINGQQGNELKYRNTVLSSQYLRVGFESDETTWRVFQLRKDFFPAAKLQMEDDITASVIVPTKLLKTPINTTDKKACKISKNVEYRLFQRPDDAIYRGFDKQTEYDFSVDGHFVSNYQPMTKDEVKNITKDVVRLYQFTEPMRKNLQNFVSDKENRAKYLVSSAHPRLVKRW